MKKSFKNGFGYMQTTSYFIALTLDYLKIKVFFENIEKYIVKNGLSSALQMQNMETMHITIFYLTNQIASQAEIKNFLKQIKFENDVFVETFDYFYRNEKEFILYLKPNKLDLLPIRNTLENRYKNFSADDNKLAFVPHISLFKILDDKNFSSIKSDLELFLEKEIEKIKNINITTKTINLYGANSKFSPEKQFII